MVETFEDDDPRPPLRKATVRITNANLLALNTTVQTVLPGVQGKHLVPELISLVKEAGTAYTIGSATTLQFRYATSSGAIVASTGGLDGWINVAAQTTQLIYAPSTGSVMRLGMWLDTTGSDTEGAGSPIVAFMAAANVSGGTGDLILNIYYREWSF